MKAKFLIGILIIYTLFSLISCSSNSSDDLSGSSDVVKEYNYNEDELKLVEILNQYRSSKELSTLILVNHISYKSQEHNAYMIDNNVVNHDYFNQRARNIKSVLDAKKVGENIAYNFSTPNAAFNAWLNSQGHKENIEGDYTHFGVSISINPNNNKKYFTTIFMKK